MLLIYLIIINATGFVLMLWDKRKAIKKAWRIPERTLFAVAILGGSLGSLLGMHLFRHKTKHLSFLLGIPCILILHIILGIILYCT